MKLKRPSRRFLRLWLTVLIGIPILLLYVGFPIFFAYIVTHMPRAAVTESPTIPYEDVMLTTSDNVELAGWYIPSENGAAILLIHGAGGNRGHFTAQAEMLARHGYGVLLIDLRGHGDSAGQPMAHGWNGAVDVGAALDYLQTRDDVQPEKIGALGYSLGGQILLHAAATDSRIQAVVSDGASFATFDGFMQTEQWWKGIAAPAQWLQFQSSEIFSGLEPPRPLYELVPQIAPRSVMFIAAQTAADEVEFNTLYFELSGEPRAYWEVPGVGHIGAFGAYPDEYEERVIMFFDAALIDE